MDVGPHPHVGLSEVACLFDGEIMLGKSLGIELPIPLPGRSQLAAHRPELFMAAVLGRLSSSNSAWAAEPRWHGITIETRGWEGPAACGGMGRGSLVQQMWRSIKERSQP